MKTGARWVLMLAMMLPTGDPVRQRALDELSPQLARELRACRRTDPN